MFDHETTYLHAEWTLACHPTGTAANPYCCNRYSPSSSVQRPLLTRKGSLSEVSPPSRTFVFDPFAPPPSESPDISPKVTEAPLPKAPHPTPSPTLQRKRTGTQSMLIPTVSATAQPQEQSTGISSSPNLRAFWYPPPNISNSLLLLCTHKHTSVYAEYISSTPPRSKSTFRSSPESAFLTRSYGSIPYSIFLLSIRNYSFLFFFFTGGREKADGAKQITHMLLVENHVWA